MWRAWDVHHLRLSSRAHRKREYFFSHEPHSLAVPRNKRRFNFSLSTLYNDGQSFISYSRAPTPHVMYLSYFDTCTKSYFDSNLVGAAGEHALLPMARWPGYFVCRRILLKQSLKRLFVYLRPPYLYIMFVWSSV